MMVVVGGSSTISTSWGGRPMGWGVPREGNVIIRRRRLVGRKVGEELTTTRTMEAPPLSSFNPPPIGSRLRSAVAAVVRRSGQPP